MIGWLGLRPFRRHLLPPLLGPLSCTEEALRSSETLELAYQIVEASCNVMAHGDGREGKWRGNWRMEWVASTFHTTSEHGVSSITTADAHTSAASSRLNWRHRPFKWTRPFRLKTKSGFCACAITFELASTTSHFPDLKMQKEVLRKIDRQTTLHHIWLILWSGGNMFLQNMVPVWQAILHI